MSYEIFEKLCKAKGVNARTVSIATGIDSGTLSHWKNGHYEPKADKRRLIAEYFGVSLEYLDTGDLDKETQERVYESRPIVRKLFSIAQGLPDEEVEKMIKIFEIQYGIKPDEDE